ncbi:hypothetical protein ACOMHN_011967 [Nucella lapillus]
MDTTARRRDPGPCLGPALCIVSGTGNPDNGFDIFANLPTDEEGEEVEGLRVGVEEIFEDDVTAPLPTYQLPPDNLDSNPETVVLQDDLVKHLRVSQRHLQSLSPGLRSGVVQLSGEAVQRMLEGAVFHRASHATLLESEKVAVIRLTTLQKGESSLETLSRRASSKAVLTSTSALLDLQSDGDSALTRLLGDMALGEVVGEGKGSDIKVKGGKDEVLRVLGERVPRLAHPVSEKAMVKREKLIAPSVLGKHLPLPKGFSHSPPTSQFSRNWSHKIGGGGASSSSSSSYNQPPPAFSGMDRTFLSRDSKVGIFSSVSAPQPGDAASRMKPPRSLGPGSGLEKSLCPSSSLSSLCGFSSSSSSSSHPSSTASNVFTALPTFTSCAFPAVSFQSAMFQPKAIKTEQPGDCSDGGRIPFSSPLTHSPQIPHKAFQLQGGPSHSHGTGAPPQGHGGQCHGGQGHGGQGHGPPPDRGSSHGHGASQIGGGGGGASHAGQRGGKGSGFVPGPQHGGDSSRSSSTSSAGGNFYSRGVHNSSANALESRNSQSHSSSTAVGGGGGGGRTTSSGFSRGVQGSSTTHDESLSFRVSDSAGGLNRNIKRGFTPSSLPYSKSLPPGLNPSVVIKTSGQTLSAVAAAGVVKSTSQSGAVTSSNSSSHGNSARPKPGMEGGGSGSGYGNSAPKSNSQDYAWKGEVKYVPAFAHSKTRWTRVGGMKTSSSSSSLTTPSSACMSKEGGSGGGGSKWPPSYCHNSYPPSGLDMAASSSSNPRESPGHQEGVGKEVNKPSWHGPKPHKSPHSLGGGFSYPGNPMPAGGVPSSASSSSFQGGGGAMMSSSVAGPGYGSDRGGYHHRERDGYHGKNLPQHGAGGRDGFGYVKAAPHHGRESGHGRGDTAYGGRDNPHGGRDTSRDNVHGGRDTSRDNVHGSRDTSRDNVHGSRDTSKDNSHGGRSNSRDNPHGSRDSSLVRDISRDSSQVRDSSRDSSLVRDSSYSRDPNAFRRDSSHAKDSNPYGGRSSGGGGGGGSGGGSLGSRDSSHGRDTTTTNHHPQYGRESGSHLRTGSSPHHGREVPYMREGSRGTTHWGGFPNTNTTTTNNNNNNNNNNNSSLSRPGRSQPPPSSSESAGAATTTTSFSGIMPNNTNTPPASKLNPQAIHSSKNTPPSSSSSSSAPASKHREGGRDAVGSSLGVRTYTSSTSSSSGSAAPKAVSRDAAAPTSGGGTKPKASNSQWDFDQMFSDESSSNSFTTNLDNLDYDNSLSPAASSSASSSSSSSSPSTTTTTAATTTTTATTIPSHSRGGGGGVREGMTPSSSGGVKEFVLGAFGGFATSTGKDGNDNDIQLTHFSSSSSSKS